VASPWCLPPRDKPGNGRFPPVTFATPTVDILAEHYLSCVHSIFEFSVLNTTAID
jgi:hypothetical protein